MGKRVELTKEVYKWLLRHPFVSEEVIIGVVKYSPRNYTDEEHFETSIRRKKNHSFVLITIGVHETSELLRVFKTHSKRL